MIKLKFQSDILKYSNKFIISFYFLCFCNFFIYIFFIYIKMSKNLSVKYYQENKEILQKIVCE